MLVLVNVSCNVTFEVVVPNIKCMFLLLSDHWEDPLSLNQQANGSYRDIWSGEVLRPETKQRSFFSYLSFPYQLMGVLYSSLQL